MSQHRDYKYSVTIHSDDLALVCAMRGLSLHCQETGNARIAWGGTKRGDWQRDGHKVTFHFNSTRYRDNFISEATRLFPTGWEKTVQSDKDPATPQSGQED